MNYFIVNHYRASLLRAIQLNGISLLHPAAKRKKKERVKATVAPPSTTTAAAPTPAPEVTRPRSGSTHREVSVTETPTKTVAKPKERQKLFSELRISEMEKDAQATGAPLLTEPKPL